MQEPVLVFRVRLGQIVSFLCAPTIIFNYICIYTSQVALVVKNPSATAGEIEDLSSIPGSGRSPGGGGMATPSSILAWRIPWTEVPGGLRSIRSRSVRHDWSDLAGSMHASTYIKNNLMQKSKYYWNFINLSFFILHFFISSVPVSPWEQKAWLLLLCAPYNS